MIKLENVVLASPEQMEFIIQGMRNPLNSWDKSDSHNCKMDGSFCMDCIHKNVYCLGKNDHSLMQLLAKAGTDHRKFMRMMPVYVRITAPLYWWKEFDTYKVGTVSNSCSTMHKIQEKEFTLEDFSCEHLISDEPIPTRIYSAKQMMEATIVNLNLYRDLYLACDTALKSDKLYGINPMDTREEIKKEQKEYWWQMIQLLPSSYNQTRNVMLNYEVLANIYKSRKSHKLKEWRVFCKWIETLPYSELITGEEKED